MTATITYKGNTLATASNNTKVLETEGTYLEDDITVTDVTAIATLITKSITANGTYNASSDSADGYSSVTVNVSGSGGLECESGTYTPASDVAQPTISFTNIHTTRPSVVAIIDITENVATTSSIYMWSIVNWIDWAGHGYYTSASTINYARINYIYKNSSSASNSGNSILNLTGATSSCLPYYLTESAFMPYVGNSFYFRSERSYKWIAVWKPS